MFLLIENVGIYIKFVCSSLTIINTHAGTNKNSAEDSKIQATTYTVI